MKIRTRVLTAAAGAGLLVIVTLVVAFVFLGSTRPGDAASHVTHVARRHGPCSWYTSPQGSVRAGGRSPKRPTTLRFASRHIVPGDVVCLEAGRYTLHDPLDIRRAGTASQWIVFRSYGGHALLTSRFTSDGALVLLEAPAAYLEFRDLRFDGGGTNAAEAIHTLQSVHHISVIDNIITHMGAAGIATSSSDYITVVGNRIYRFGDGDGWGSGVSLNSSDGAWWYDRAPGFHNVIARNIIAGGVDNSSHHSDGNGIILDLGGEISPTLIASNLIYMNGGSGIVSLQTSGLAYIVNNTLYHDGLDPRVGGAAELIANQSSNQVWANNIAYAWSGRSTYALESTAGVTFVHDAEYGGLGTEGVPADALTGADTIQREAPRFVLPPAVESADAWRTAPSPSQLGNGLALKASSPLVNAGVDLLTLPGLDDALQAGIKAYALISIDGITRPLGHVDYGAFEQ